METVFQQADRADLRVMSRKFALGIAVEMKHTYKQSNSAHGDKKVFPEAAVRAANLDIGTLSHALSKRKDQLFGAPLNQAKRAKDISTHGGLAVSAVRATLEVGEHLRDARHRRALRRLAMLAGKASQKNRII